MKLTKETLLSLINEEVENQEEIYLDEKLSLKPARNGWKLYSQLVAAAYDAAPMEDLSSRSSYDALEDFINKFFERMSGKYTIDFVDYHPYSSATEMKNRVAEEGVLLVSTADDEHPVFSPETNAKFRAFHDLTGHIQRGLKFSLKHEIATYNSHLKLVPPAAVPALFTEVVGQICCFYNSGKSNCEQKAVLLQGFDYFNVGVVEGYDIVDKELVRKENV